MTLPIARPYPMLALAVVLSAALIACAPTPTAPPEPPEQGALEPAHGNDSLFHHSVMDSMRNGVYAGEASVRELKRHGDFGLGTFDRLDGEMIALDGVFYRVAGDGRVAPAAQTRTSPFASLAFFNADVRSALRSPGDLARLQSRIEAMLPSRNRFYAIRISGRFAEVTAGGARKVEDHRSVGLAERMRERPLYRRGDVAGTLVGFYHPVFAGGIDLTPFHWHFLSDDRRFGGHLVGLRIDDVSLRVALDEKHRLELELPRNPDFAAPWKQPAAAPKAGY